MVVKIVSVLDGLINHDKWLQFLEEKNLKKREYQKLKQYIEEKRYLPISQKIVEEAYTFSIPQKKLINKNHSSKKRVIYQFREEENIILKMIHFLFSEYEFLLCDNCYSFRRKVGPKQAFLSIQKSFSGYGYKVDIQNYFNSIPIDSLLEILNGKIDEKSYRLLEKILLDDRVLYDGKILYEKKGVMAGTPISCFLSNIYLSPLDFQMNDSNYARYADDIILFASTKEELEKKVFFIKQYFKEASLEINLSKEKYYTPNEKLEFLGFSYFQGTIDLSNHAKEKMKTKIKRKAKALRRWAIRKNIPLEKALKSMNTIFNYKFFYEKKGKELNWSIWYFPVINSVSGLREIDNYFQKNLRYIMTGNYHESNQWKVPYQLLKENGYKSLVNAYYKFKEF